MAIADDLLTLAEHLTNPSATDPEQAWLRRSISTAYYALFHLFICEAAQRWMGSPAAKLGLERVFKHDQMKEVSRSVGTGSWKGWSTPRLPIPADLRDVAFSFVKLQESRHEADYNNEKSWSQSDVTGMVLEARIAFQKWQSISGSAVADEFLLSLLIGKKRE